MSGPQLSTRAWLKAGLITFALVVHTIWALPKPHAVGEAELKTAEGREEMQRWIDLLGSVGIQLTIPELSKQVVYWTSAVNDVHSVFRRPFKPWMKYTGTGQGWALFASPDTYPHRLEIYVLIDREWRPVYRRNHPTLDWMDPTLRYRRVRGIYDGSTRRQRVVYWNFSRWLAKRAFLAYPKAGKVRIQMVQSHTTMPWEAPDPEETVRVKRVFNRSAILPSDGLAP